MNTVPVLGRCIEYAISLSLFTLLVCFIGVIAGCRSDITNKSWIPKQMIRSLVMRIVLVRIGHRINSLVTKSIKKEEPSHYGLGTKEDIFVDI
jgi:hypothetical protein